MGLRKLNRLGSMDNEEKAEVYDDDDACLLEIIIVFIKVS